ncbi:putative mitogen-activated protein kinase kinase kinase STE-STE11 family [Helianthus debilis subsp. tardiflorus]
MMIQDDGKLYIFLELVIKGSLAKLYQKYELRDSQVSVYTRQILRGLIYLHERKVVHSGSAKLADFGFAKVTTLGGIKSCKGTPYWMAPEVIFIFLNAVCLWLRLEVEILTRL